MSKKEATLKATVELGRAISYLEDVLSSLKAGKVCVANCDQFVTLVPERIVKFSLEVAQKEDRDAIAIEISWRKQPLTTPDEELDLAITSMEPSRPACSTSITPATTSSEE